MINTKYMSKLREYNYYGVIEAAYRRGKYYYISIIDHRNCDSKLVGIYDELGVKRVSSQYVEKWLSYRFN